MKTSVKFFGLLTEITKIAECDIKAPVDTDSLLQKLYSEFPGLRSASFIIAVNNNVIKENTALTGNSTVTLMPPYSGG